MRYLARLSSLLRHVHEEINTAVEFPNLSCVSYLLRSACVRELIFVVVVVVVVVVVLLAHKISLAWPTGLKLEHILWALCISICFYVCPNNNPNAVFNNAEGNDEHSGVNEDVCCNYLLN